MSMVMLYREELEDRCPQVIRMYPDIQDLIVPREILPSDFEIRTPTLLGVSPDQVELARQAFDEYLEPEIEIVIPPEPVHKEPVNDGVAIHVEKPKLPKNLMERFLCICAIVATLFIMIGGLFSVSTAGDIPIIYQSKILFVPDVAIEEEPVPAGERMENVIHHPQREITLPHSQPRASDWHEPSPKLRLRFVDTDIELTGVTSEFEIREFLEATTAYIEPRLKAA